MLTNIPQLAHNGITNMAADKKTPANIDKIDDIETQVKSVEAPEEKVISIHIPRRTTPGTSEITKEKVSENSDEATTNSEVKQTEPEHQNKTDYESVTDSDMSSEPPKDSVSSFSLLDADKKSEDKPLESVPEKAPVAEVSSPETKETTTDTNNSLDKWLEEAEPSTMTDTPSTMPTEKKGGKLKAFFIALVIVMILGAIGGGIYYYTTRVSNQDNSTVTPTTDLPTPTFTPTPTESPEPVELSDYSVEVLNGSGVAGKAGVIATLLEEEGFASADAANADNQDYTDTLVLMKADIPEGVFTELERILGKDYVLELSSDKLDEDSEYDVQVILGSSEPEAVEEATTPTPTVEEEPGI